jgi:hypothetical protein
MTTTNHISAARERWSTSHGRSRCPQKLVDSFWLPSLCPNGVNALWPLDALTDAEEVTWDGGNLVVASYVCACCGKRWTQKWPAALALGPNWRRREPPVHLVAGVDAPRHTAGQFTPEGLLAG